MASPLKKTLDLLSTSPCPAAISVLLHGLTVPETAVREGVLNALFRRRSVPGIQELLRQADHFTPEMWRLLERNLATLSLAFRPSLLCDEELLRNNTLETIRAFEDFSQIGTLLSLLEIQDYGSRDRLLVVLRDLIDRLYEYLKFGRETKSAATGEAGSQGKSASGNANGAEAGAPDSHPRKMLRDAERIRLHTLTVLEQACLNYNRHQAREVVDGLLILADPENRNVQRVLREAPLACRQMATEILQTSTHPAIISLVFGALSQNYPFPGSLAAFEHRSDAEFIGHLLRNWPRKLTMFQQKNLKQLQRLAWLDPDDLQLEIVPPGLHRSLIAFVLSTGVPESHRQAMLEWMLKHGSADGRSAASDVIVDLEDNKVQEVILEGLESEDAEMQAWATGQLRTRDVPQAFSLLIRRLDSPMPEVQEAARRELGDFDLQRALQIYDHLDPQVCRAVGRLIQKIDVQTITKLRHELVTAIRRKRIRAARAALALGLHEQVADALVLMTQDTDALVRRTAAEVLGEVSAAASARPLTALLEDPSPRVREAARHSLRRIQEALTSVPSVGQEELELLVSVGSEHSSEE